MLIEKHKYTLLHGFRISSTSACQHVNIIYNRNAYILMEKTIVEYLRRRMNLTSLIFNILQKIDFRMRLSIV